MQYAVVIINTNDIFVSLGQDIVFGLGASIRLAIYPLNNSPHFYYPHNPRKRQAEMTYLLFAYALTTS